jgi:membrane-associated phospholipid phosphatase
VTDSQSASTSESGSREHHEHYVGPLDVTTWSTRVGRRVAGAHQRLAKRVGAHGALLVSLIGGAAIAVAATYATTRLYDAVVGSNGIESIDRPILKRAITLRSAELDATAAAIARAFGPIGLPAIALTVAGALSLRQKSRTPLILTAVATAGSLAMTIGGKDMIDRHRPERRYAIPPFESSPSFPSGHTLNTTTLAGVIAYLIVLQQRRNLPQIATIGAAVATSVTVGLSRVLLGAHWFTDVLTGWISGSGWVSLVITSHRLYLTSRSQNASSGTNSGSRGSDGQES